MRNAFALILLLSFLSCTSQSRTSVKIDAVSFEKAITGNNVQVLDVRTSQEFNSGHIKNALQSNWNNQTEFVDRIQYLDKDKSVYVYCMVGARSAAAADWMRNNGFKNVIELNGGINAWKKLNKPLEENAITEKQLTIEEYQAKIPLDKTTLVEFGAPWCPPCVKMQPVLDDLISTKNLNFQFVKIDAGLHLNVMNELKIEPIPVFIVYKNGKETWRKVGLVTKEELIAQIQ
jgi:rhodanese-related sulfurtransferase